MSHETRAERAIRRAIIHAEWKAQADDTVDGWCVLDAASAGTPATGNVPIAHFCHAEAARHMAAIHNVWLAHQGHLPIPATIEATVRVQVAEEIAQALLDFEVNDSRGRADMGIDRAVAICREIGSRGGE